MRRCVFGQLPGVMLDRVPKSKIRNGNLKNSDKKSRKIRLTAGSVTADYPAVFQSGQSFVAWRRHSEGFFGCWFQYFVPIFENRCLGDHLHFDRNQNCSYFLRRRQYYGNTFNSRALSYVCGFYPQYLRHRL